MNNKLILNPLSLLFLILTMVVGCSDDKTEETVITVKRLKVSTDSVILVGETTAKVKGSIISLGEKPIIKHGHCWDLNNSPDLNDSLTDLGSLNELESFESELTKLQPATTYYVKAYAYDGESVKFGEPKHFTTTHTPDTWILKQSLPMARHSLVAFTIDTLIYAGSGSDDATYSSAFWCYDPSSNTWKQIADFAGQARKNAVAFVLNNFGFVGTGETLTGKTNDFWKYSPQTNTWSKIKNLPGLVRTAAVSFVINDAAYVAGGEYNSTLQDLWEFKTFNETWTQKEDMPHPKSKAVACAYNNVGFVLGGKNNSSNSNTTLMYVSAQNKWVSKSNSEVYQSAASSFLINSRIYIVGSEVEEYQKQVWLYDLVNDTWLRKSDFPGNAKQATVGVTLKNKGYIIGGLSSTLNRENWLYLP